MLVLTNYTNLYMLVTTNIRQRTSSWDCVPIVPITFQIGFILLFAKKCTPLFVGTESFRRLIHTRYIALICIYPYKNKPTPSLRWVQWVQTPSTLYLLAPSVPTPPQKPLGIPSPQTGTNVTNFLTHIYMYDTILLYPILYPNLYPF